ncbi:hypothetical protein [Geodermatophilus sp. SYSU D01036]
MQQRRRHRATTSLVGALAFTAALSVTAPPALTDPQKAEPVSVFPSDTLTVRDPAQLTGRRVDLPTAGCGAAISCGLVQQLNQLDGFDLDPRLAIRLSRPVDVATAASITVQEARGGWRTGVDRVVRDPATNTLYAHPAQQLAPGTTYWVRVQGGPTIKAAQDTFTTQMPLRGEGPVTVTVPGAVEIQEHLARSTWLSRPGSPETFAPLIDPQRVLVQVAYGDRTVPNPTSYTLVDAGHPRSRTSLYRNDKATPPLPNPHSFLLVLTHPSALQGQAQVAAFLRSGQVVDPDAGGAVWEVPIGDPSVLLRLNYAQPALRP